ncbi:hypothetical protein KO498_08190 [Lentibacter algarum]|nr:hypothetical protein [Lentibacter algarum]
MIPILFNVAMLIWMIYETFVVAGAFGAPPSNFPLGKDFGLYLIGFFWILGNAIWALIELIIYLRSR